MSEHWRELSPTKRRRLSEEIGRQSLARLQDGLRKFGPRFVGDPLEDAAEEALDLLNYLAVGRREREYLRLRVARLEDALRAHNIELPDDGA